ncbi:MAG: hypothetical protein ABSF98_28545 [Bryobacteraceae bacterium]
MIPYIRDILTATIAHPWLSAFALVATYSIAMVAIAHIAPMVDKHKQREIPPEAALQPMPAIRVPQPAPVRRLKVPMEAEAALSDALRLTSPDGIDVLIRSYHQPDTGIDGLLVSIGNARTETLNNCTARVNGAQNFDSKMKIFRDDPLAHIQLAPFGDISPGSAPAGHAQWLVRINQKEQLQLSNVEGIGVLHWPNTEPPQVQTWRLWVSIVADGLAPWEFHFRAVWPRQSRTIKVRRP